MTPGSGALKRTANLVNLAICCQLYIHYRVCNVHERSEKTFLLTTKGRHVRAGEQGYEQSSGLGPSVELRELRQGIRARAQGKNHQDMHKAAEIPDSTTCKSGGSAELCQAPVLCNTMLCSEALTISRRVGGSLLHSQRCC